MANYNSLMINGCLSVNSGKIYAKDIILKGTKNIPVPKARIKVPNKTRITLKIVCKTRLILGFNFLIILANFLSLHL